jgi:hypothetical protein
MNNNNVCNNCGKQGHLFHQCKLPITSYGVIVFRHSDKGLQFLMIRRKDSFGYIDFIRGKYVCYNIEQIQQIVDEMSLCEKSRLLDESFENLWKLLWGDCKIQYKGEEVASSKKYDLIKNGIVVNDKKITLEAFVSMEAEWSLIKLISKQILEYPKWTFPHINERGDGDKFYIQFTSITNDPNDPNNIDIEITLALPGLKIPIHRSFQFEPVFPKDPNVFAVKATVLESKNSPVQDMFGYVYFFKNPKNPSKMKLYS